MGNPGQGYAVVASGDLAKPPVSTGVQDAVVVRVTFDDVALVPGLANLQNRLANAGKYISAVSYGQASLVPAFRGPIALDHPKSYYYHPDRSLLIELTEEVVAKLVATEPTLFDTIERLVIVTNDVNFDDDAATTGPWPIHARGPVHPSDLGVGAFLCQPAGSSHARVAPPARTRLPLRP